MDITLSARTGLAKAFERLERSAARTAAFGRTDTDVDLAGEAVEQITARQEAGANITVLKVADEMMARLMDLKA